MKTKPDTLAAEAGRWFVIATHKGAHELAHRLHSETPDAHGAVSTVCGKRGRILYPVPGGSTVTPCGRCWR